MRTGIRGNGRGILKEVTAFSFRAVFTRGARDGALKNSLETQRQGMQMDFMYATKTVLHHDYKLFQICWGRERQSCVMEF